MLNIKTPKSYAEIRAEIQGYDQNPFQMAIELTRRVLAGPLHRKQGGVNQTTMYCEKRFPKGYKCPKRSVEP